MTRRNPNVYVEHNGDGLSINEAYDANAECRHGRLPTDANTERCGCWERRRDRGVAPVVWLNRPALIERERQIIAEDDAA